MSLDTHNSGSEQISSMARKPSHEQFDTLQVLRDHAFELFGRYGYEGVSIGDIAKLAKLSKGALYWHFPGKDALYLDCLRRLHSLFNQHIFDVMRSAADPIHGILAIFHGISRLMEDPRVARGVAGYWLIPPTPEAEAILTEQRAFEAASMKVIRETLRRGTEQGRLNLGDDLDDMSRAIISIIEVAILPLRHQSRADSQRTLGVLARTLFRAYASADDLLQQTRRL